MATLFRVSLLTAIVLLSWTGAARADQIDGSWCSPSGKSMTIEGSQAVIPSGKTIIGRYTRHHFDYVVPQGDADAGNRVSADQIDDEHIRVTEGRHVADPPKSHVIWTRCEVVS